MFADILSIMVAGFNITLNGISGKVINCMLTF